MSLAISPDSARIGPQTASTLRRLPRLPADKNARIDAFQSNIAKRTDYQLVPATPGDHLAIQRLLLEVTQTPSAAEFQAMMDYPAYAPDQRLLVKHVPSQRVLGHVQLFRREINFGVSALSAVDVADLAVLPEFGRHEFDDDLLAEAESQARRDGALIVATRTTSPLPYLRRGWVPCGRHCYSSAGPRRILSGLHLDKPPTSIFDSQPTRYFVRSWRHFEQDSLTRLYSRHASESYGCLSRSDDYWRWLIVRRGFERIYVAVESDDESTIFNLNSRIVAYAVVNDGCILELVDDSEGGLAGSLLLSRICGEAIEHGRHTLRYCSPPNDPRHQWIRDVGGTYAHGETDNNVIFLAKLMDATGLVRQLVGELQRRAKNAGMSRGQELGLSIDGDRCKLQMGPRGIRVTTRGKMPRSQIAMTDDAATQLFLGHTSIDELIQARAAKPSTDVAVRLARILFPTVPFWRSPLDDLRAS